MSSSHDASQIRKPRCLLTPQKPCVVPGPQPDQPNTNSSKSVALSPGCEVEARLLRAHTADLRHLRSLCPWQQLLKLTSMVSTVDSTESLDAGPCGSTGSFHGPSSPTICRGPAASGITTVSLQSLSTTSAASESAIYTSRPPDGVVRTSTIFSEDDIREHPRQHRSA